MKSLKVLKTSKHGSVGGSGRTKISKAKSKDNKDMIIQKRIIADSIKDNLIPQVSSWETPKEMFDVLSDLFEGRNINKKMTLRNHIKSVRTKKSETMQSYFQE